MIMFPPIVLHQTFLNNFEAVFSCLILSHLTPNFDLKIFNKIDFLGTNSQGIQM